MIRAIKNLTQGAKMYPLWIRLAISDIHQIYRRSIIGIAWITFSFTLFIKQCFRRL